MANRQELLVNVDYLSRLIVEHRRLNEVLLAFFERRHRTRTSDFSLLRDEFKAIQDATENIRLIIESLTEDIKEEFNRIIPWGIHPIQ